MDNVSSTREIYLEDFIDSSAYFLTQDGPTVHLWPHHGKENEIFENLTRNPIAHVRNVFRRRDIPVEYHWKNNRRIPPIVIDPEVGWVVLRSRNNSFSDKGSHGWPSSQSKSYSIFYARGPAFRNGITVKPFRTVDLYPLMCKLLGIEPRPNNGSLANVGAVLKKTDMETLKGTQDFARPSLGLAILLVAVGLSGACSSYRWRARQKCWTFCRTMVPYWGLYRKTKSSADDQRSQCWTRKRTLPRLLRKMSSFYPRQSGTHRFFPTPKK